MVDQRNNNIDSWTRVGIRAIEIQTGLATNEGKYLFVWDKTDTVSTFFKYKGILVEFFPEVIKVELGRKSVAEALDVVRKGFVHAQRIGGNLMIDLGKTKANWMN